MFAVPLGGRPDPDEAPEPASEKHGLGGGCILVGVLFFGVLAVASGGFVLYSEVLRPAREVLRARGWTATPCTIVSSQVAEHRSSPDALATWRAAVTYTYRFGDREYTADRCDLGDPGAFFGEYAPEQDLAERYPAGQPAVCYVNPRDPAAAVLERRLPAGTGMLVWVGLCFLVVGALLVVAGGAGLLALWRTVAAGAAGKPPGAPVGGVVGRVVAVLFAAAFMLFCGLFAWVSLLSPLGSFLRARSWVRTPCAVTSSRMIVVHGKSTTYGAELFYAYTFAGKPHVGSRYSLSGWRSSSGRAAKEQLVASLAPGTATFCWVNPRDPTEAVLDRGFPLGCLWGLIPLGLFVLVPGGLLYLAWRGPAPGGRDQQDGGGGIVPG